MNPRVCILTDSTAQFPNPGFPGHEHVKVLPLQVRLNGKSYLDGRELKTSQLPASARDGLKPQVLPPSVESFQEVLLSLGRQYNDIIVIHLSAQLNPAVRQAQSAAAAAGVPATVSILDSQSTSAGLGLLVQAAAKAAQEGMPAVEIKHLLRTLIPRVYSLFCVQSLSYLANNGLMDPAQALVGEMLGFLPLFALENGRLTPIQKARSFRQMVEIFHEYIGEFITLKHVALVQGVPSLLQETRYLRERILESIPTTPFSEHTLGAGLAAILGPRSLGLVAMENLDGRRI